MGEFSVIHWLIVIGILLLLFGPSKLPQLGEGLGMGIRNFKKALKEKEEGDSKSIDSSKDSKVEDEKKKT